MLTPAILAVLAVLLAGPVPWLLGRSPALRRTPRAAMVLWQSVALSAVLAALGAGVSLATESGVVRDDRPAAAAWVVAGLALLATLTVLGRLLLSGHRVGTSLRRIRRRHRHLVDVLARTEEGPGSARAQLRVLRAEAPMAYCLPGVGASRVVLSEATVDALDEIELAAVLAHEHAHLRARHDLVVEAFTVLQQAFPAVVISRRALAEVRLLVEVLADRAARARHGAAPLVRALSALVGSYSPHASLGVASVGLRERLDVLLDERPHRLQAAAVFLIAAAVLLLPTALVVVPWLQRTL